VLAGGEMRAVRLDAAGEDEAGGLAGLDGVAHFHPGELFRPDAVEGGDRPRRGHFGFSPPGGFGLLFRRQLRSLRARIRRLRGNTHCQQTTHNHQSNQ